MNQITIEAGDARITIAPQSTSISVFNTLEQKDLAEFSREVARRVENALGATPKPRFTKIAPTGQRLAAGSNWTDHVAVIDNTTGLMWSVESLGDETDPDTGVAHDHAMQRCKDLRLLDFEDWRLPTRAELVTLIDDTRHDPAIDTDAFPRVKPRWHWTSTPAAGLRRARGASTSTTATSATSTATSTGSRWRFAAPVSNWPFCSFHRTPRT